MIFSTPQRREFLWQSGGGLGALAFAHLLAGDAEKPTKKGPYKGLHHSAKVQRVIQLFMNGGASPQDTFDYKPQLVKLHGQKFDPGGEHVESVTNSPGFPVMKSPFEFKQYGKCGRWVSSVFPHLAQRVDELTFLMSMASKTNVHGPGSYMMNTGFMLPGFPSMGAWLSYGLGRITDELPTFVVIPDARGLPYNQLGNFSSGFLPVVHQGTVLRPTAPTPIASLTPPPSAKFITPNSETEGQALLKQLNQEHATQNPGDSRLDARMSAYELAAKMQLSAPKALDLNKESAATQKLYGLDDKTTEAFGRHCLVGRRLLEAGVRFVQIWSGAGGPSNNWDNHANIPQELPKIAGSVDKPIAGLLQDLKAHGLLDDTLVIWTTEFGRQPFSQGQAGRDHNMGTFVTWLAGAGVKPGVAHGESDEWAWRARTPIYCYDLHATILHLMGINHEKLTFRHNGSDRRLTDVHGHVIDEILELMTETKFDVEACRAQFPALQRRENGQPVVYLDGPAGSQVPQRVVEAISTYLLHHNANHGGVFGTGVESDALLDLAHQAAADFLGADDPNCIVFGQNMTSLTFALSHALARTWKPGDEIIVTRLDHDANISPWVLAARDAGATVHQLDFRRDDCTLDLAQLERLLTSRTRWVAVGCASNAVGTVNPVGAMIERAHAVGAKVFLDAVHYAPHALIDVKQWDCDALACSAYKFFGPHVGVLWGPHKLLESLPAYKVRPAPDDLPGRWMTGTQSHEGIAGVLACIDYIAHLGSVIQPAASTRRAALMAAFAALQQYEQTLAAALLEGLARLPKVKVFGIRDRLQERVPTVAITVAGHTSEAVAQFLAQRGIYVWHGHFYAQTLVETLGLTPDGLVRLGLLHYTTVAEVERLLATLAELCEPVVVSPEG